MPRHNNTDERLVSIMESGERMLIALDPDNLLGKATAEGMSYKKDTGQWTIKIKTEKGYYFKLSGTGQKAFIITKVEYLESPGKWETAKTETPSGNLTSAFGRLSSLPQEIKKRLSSRGMARDFTATPPDLDMLVENAKKALFWNIETKKATDIEKDFHTFKFRYEYDERNGYACGVEFAAISQMQGCLITIRTEADCFGLKNKKVILDKNLGNGHLCSVNCFVKNENIQKPSVRIAYDLAVLIPEFYAPQSIKKEKNVIGKGNGKKKK